MKERVAVFPALLGAAFDSLDAPLRRVHRGDPGTYCGTASVQRGRGWLARLACGLAGMPQSMQHQPVRVEIRTGADGETWTRWFGNSPPMRSRLRAGTGRLIERLGPAVLQFHLQVRDGVLHWEARRMRFLGMPLPSGVFDFRARVHGSGGRYHFLIDARLAGVGDLIRYDGVLHVEP